MDTIHSGEDLLNALTDLHLSRERYALAQRAASIGSWDWVIATNELHWSDAIEPMFGYGPGEFDGTFAAFFDRVHPDDLGMILNAVNACIANNAEYRVEHRIIWPDGTVRWVLEQGDVQRDAAGNALRMLGVVQDITSRKTTEQALRDSEERYRLLVEMLPETVLVHRSGILQYVNAAGLRLFEIESPEDVIGKHVGEFIHADDREMVANRIAQLDQGTSVPLVEQTLVRSDGSSIQAEVISAPFNFEGQPAALVIVRDITDRKQAEAALRASEERYRVMLEAIPDLILRMSGDGDYLDVIESDSVPLVRPFPSLVGYNVRDVLQPHEAEAALERYREVLAADTPITREYMLTIDGEERYFDDRLVSYGNNEILSVVRDITARKRAEQHMLDLIIERERVQLLTNFITNASHEFRTPLSIIGLKAYLLYTEPNMERRDTYLSDIRAQIESLSHLIDDLLIMARLDSRTTLELRPLDFYMLVQWMCTSLAESAEEANLTLTCTIARDLPPLVGHMDYLQKAFENILHNALRYTPPGGEVHVAVEHNDSAILTTVRDTGVGMTADQLARVFERFYRGDEAHSTRGFGLGLPLARAIIERHGGTIVLESTPGEGTTVHITLPLRRALPSTHPPSPPSTTTPRPE